MALTDVIARLAVSLSMDSAALLEGASLAEKRMEQSRQRFQKIGRRMTDLGKTMSLSITAPLAALAVSSYKAAQESADALGQVKSALASMGDASGRTVEQLQALAQAQMGKSLYDDDEILRKVTANLLTFGKISGTAFDQAQQAAIDLSARLGTDLQSSAIMVGKALNDPVKGVTALTRVGVSFTEAQKEQITAMAEAGNVAGAQAMILAELEKQYGGAAAAARAADPTAASKQAWADFQETVGKLVTEFLPPLTALLTGVLGAFNGLSPEMQKVVVVGGALFAALGPVLTVFGSLVTVGAPLLSFLTTVAPAIGVVAKALLLLAANPYIIGLALVIGGIYLAWKNWDKIAPILQRLYTAAKTWITDKLGAVLNGVLAPIRKVKDAFFKLYDAVVGNSYVPDMVDGIRDHMKRLDDVMVSQADKATSKTAEKFRDLKALMDRLFPENRAALDFETDMAKLKAGLSGDQLTAAADRLRRDYFGLNVAGGTISPNADMSSEPLGNEPSAARWEAVVKSANDVIDAGKKKWGEWQDAAAEAYQELSYQLKGVLLGAQSLGNALRNVVARLADMAISKAFQSLGTAIGIPAFATGTNFAPGGLALVGEHGAELVDLPRGARVHTASETSRLLEGRSGSVTMNVYTPNADSFRRSERQITSGLRRRLG